MEIVKRVSDYAVRGLVFMAKSDNDSGIFDLGTVSEKTETPFAFLQKIFRKMSQKGILETHRGINGGFSFAKKPEEITILEAIETVQGEIFFNACFSYDFKCSKESFCSLNKVLAEASTSYRKVLSQKTIADLAKEELALGH